MFYAVQNLLTLFQISKQKELGTWNEKFQVPFLKPERVPRNEFHFLTWNWNLELVPFREELAQPWSAIPCTVMESLEDEEDDRVDDEEDGAWSENEDMDEE